MSFTLFFVLFGSYLLGAVPFGLVLTRLAGLGDIRKIGSGNIGATNVLRTGNKFLAFLTLVLDSAKGAVAVLIVALYAPGFEQAAGLAAMLGHMFPVWLRFKGGKGVATGLGVMLAVSWPVALVALAVWILTVALFRISSLGAIVAVGVSPLLALYVGQSDVSLFCAGLAILILGKHHANIRRLIRGEEPRIGGRRSSK